MSPTGAGAQGKAPWSFLAPPFVVLALGLLGTFVLSAVLSRLLDNGFISLKPYAPVLAWTSFLLFAAVFLQLDGAVIGLRADRAWTSLAALWGTTARSTLGALIITAILAGAQGAVIIAGMAPDRGWGWPFVVGVTGALLVVAVRGAIRTVRARWTIRIVPKPF